MDETKFMTQLKTTQEFFANSANYSKYFSKKLSDIEKQEQDLLHYLENEKLSAVDLTRLVVTLRDIRKERREVKNMLALTTIFSQGEAKRCTLANSISKSGNTNNSYTLRSDIVEKTFGDKRKTIKFI